MAAASPTPATAAAAAAAATTDTAVGSVAASTASSAAAAPRSRKLNIFYTPVHDRNIGSVKLLLSTVMPVAYSDDFYRTIQATPADLSKLAYYDDIFVGCILSRLEPLEPGSASKRLYIAIMAVLAPYRSRGIGACLPAHVRDEAAPV